MAKSHIGIFWLYLTLFFVFYFMLSYTLLATSYRHTYQLPVDGPGTLLSDRWTFAFVRDLLTSLYLLNFVTVFYMLVSGTTQSANVNLVCSLMLFGLALVIVVFDAENIRYGQVSPDSPKFAVSNQARDHRWCCVYGHLPGAELLCLINSGCAPPQSPNELVTDDVYLTKLILNVFAAIMLFWNFVYTITQYKPKIKKK